MKKKKQIRIFGQTKGTLDAQTLELQKIDIFATPYQLRIIANFLLEQADYVESYIDDSVSGVHLRDSWRVPGQKEWIHCDIEVYNPKCLRE